jgi:hypothetical protein
MQDQIMPSVSPPPALYRRQTRAEVHVFDASAMPWHETSKAGLRLKAVLNDDERGEFLGLIGFDPFVRSGLHQHQGVATSFVIAGGLTDYHGDVNLHEVGINVRGSTHDAMAYLPTVLVSRLEGPVTYPPEHGALSGLHAGSRHATFRNPDPAVPPEVNVALDQVTLLPTGVSGLERQTAFDYAGTGCRRRMVQWRVRPETELPVWHATEGVECWVRGGGVCINGINAHANCFIVIEPGAQVHITCAFGALLLLWADGPERWPSDDQNPTINLFGF